ncbi:hypothetical protein JCM33374_g5905 [Metschnikowia sp. JCM 33374]|nr:hypothetical protein JCM33374_g5905 [Metschnikowia sp. JCM 33374]
MKVISALMIISICPSIARSHPTTDGDSSLAKDSLLTQPKIYAIEVTIYDDFPPDDIFVCPRYGDRYFINDPLEEFVSRLKGYLLDTKFEVDSFEKATGTLQRQLDYATSIAKQISHCGNVSFQIKFSQHMFQAMVEAIEMLRHCDVNGGGDLRLTSYVIDLNVRFLAFYNSYGVPEPHIPGYMYMVKRSNALLHDWKKEFDALPTARYGVRMMFQRQFSRAKETIEVLERYFSK